MNKNVKKGLIAAGITLDVCLTVFLFVVSIIMLATLPEEKSQIDQTKFIGYLQYNTTVYLCACVVPLFALLVLNIVILAMYVKKASSKAVMLEDLNEDQKAALMKALLKDVQEPSNNESEKKE